MQSSKKSNKHGTQKLEKSQSDKWSTSNELVDEDNKKNTSTTNIAEAAKEVRNEVKISEYYQSQNVASKRTDKNKGTSNIQN